MVREHKDGEPKKRCGHCKTKKPIGDFYRLKSSPDGRYPTCITCYREQREPRKKAILASRRRWENALREEVIRHYGGRCVCCKEREFEFLAIYSIRKNKSRGPSAHQLKKEGYPPNYRILCRNCGEALERHGYCPHGNMI